MFSGGDSSEGLNSLNQLGAYGFVNQVEVSNAISAGKNIDWAQLAQQWIQMRDNAGSVARNASNIRDTNIVDQNCSGLRFEEKGEADMDMDDEEQQSDEKLQKFESFSSVSDLHQTNINQPWFFSDGASSHLETQTTSSNQWSTWHNQDVLQQQPQVNTNINNLPMNSTAHIPSLLKMNVPHPNEIRIMPNTPGQPESTSNMVDSAKKKVLPAWIREGLEKMEREKQKQLEREKEMKESNNKWSDDDSEKKKDILSKSLVSVKEEGENLDEVSSDYESSVPNIEANTKNYVKDVKENDIRSVSISKTYEERVEDLMAVVRRTLTELLLETTNEEISKVAEETLKLFKSKASSAQVIQKSALSTITGKLGLAAYADSSSEENSEGEEKDSFKKETNQSGSDIDSEVELRNTIRTKRRAFVKIADEIEERVFSAAAREEEKLKYFLRKEEEEERDSIRKKQVQSLNNETASTGYSGHSNKGYEKDFGEITETKIQSFNGKRQKERNSRKERTSRFSDNKDKYVALPATAPFIANINATGITGSGAGSAATVLPSTNQRQNIPDINGLLPNYTSSGMKNVLNAADAALEKVLKRKSSESPKKQSKRYDRSRDYTPLKKRQRHSSNRKRSRSHSKSNSSSSSSSSTSSSDSDSSSTSRSSHHSKYSHRSSTKHKSHSSSGKDYNKSHKDYKDYRNYSSSHTQKNRRNASSDSDDEYNRRRKHGSKNSSYSRRYNSSRHDREHSRSLSRSSYSSSSNRRQ